MIDGRLVDNEKRSTAAAAAAREREREREGACFLVKKTRLSECHFIITL